MTAKQSNKLAMYRAVLVFLQGLLNSTTATSAFPALTAKLATLKTLLDKILGLATTQGEPITGKLGAREQALASATRTALVVSGAVLSYARTLELPDLAAQVDLVPTDFLRLRRAERMRLAQRVHDAAVPLVAQLADYGLTATTLADLQTKIDATTGAVDAPRTTKDAKKVATGQLPRVLRQVDALLSQIDPLLLPLSESDPQTYALYQAARQVFDLPGVHSSDPAAAATPAAPSTAPANPPSTHPAA